MCTVVQVMGFKTALQEKIGWDDFILHNITKLFSCFPQNNKNILFMQKEIHFQFLKHANRDQFVFN